MKKLVFLFILLVSQSWMLTGQVNPPQQILDTVETANGPVILYANHSWDYLESIPVMMDPELDSSVIFSDIWNNASIYCFTGMKPDSIQDTVLLLTTEDHGYHPPISAFNLLRGFRYTHHGLDLKLLTGDTVRAAFDGVVRYAKYNRGGYGNLVILRHYNGLETYYAHLSKLSVCINQQVKAGQLIGLGGSTGRSRGSHLHFEVRYKDVPIDPARMIRTDNRELISNHFPIRKEVFYPNDWDHEAVYYKIRSGDTLGHLAAKYHTSVKEICAMNKIRSTTTLRIGQVLRVK